MGGWDYFSHLFVCGRGSSTPNLREDGQLQIVRVVLMSMGHCEWCARKLKRKTLMAVSHMNGVSGLSFGEDKLTITVRKESVGEVVAYLIYPSSTEERYARET